MDTRPIGIFDSGLGGLTGLMALRTLLPGEDFIYFGDTGRMPYGGRPREQLRRMALQNLDFMAGQGVKAIFVACGTFSSTAADLLTAYPIPSFGVLRPSVEAMARVSGTGPLAILATEASIRSGAFAKAIGERCPGRKIIPVACPDFVPLIESGHITPGDPALEDALTRYLDPVETAGCDALLYGCTHYGIIDEAVRAHLGRRVVTVSASACGARELANYLIQSDMTGGSGRTRTCTNGDPVVFTAAAERLLGHKLEAPVESVPIQEC